MKEMDAEAKRLKKLQERMLNGLRAKLTAIVVNGVSNNRGMDWGLETGRKLIGYDPQDDLYALIKSTQ